MLFRSIASPSLPASEQAKLIANYMEMKSADTNQSYFLLPVLQFLRAMPWQVAVQGGDCADRSRLMIDLLRIRGIRASKWALYAPDGRPVHAVVEMESEQGKMVVDPLFVLWFPRPGGGYDSIQSLEHNPELLRQRVHSLRASGEEPLGWLVLGYPLDQYVYDHVRTINWNKSASMRFIYRILYSVMGDKANEIRRPYFVELPALMLVFGIAALEALLLLVWLSLRWKSRRRRTAESHGSMAPAPKSLVTVPGAGPDHAVPEAAAPRQSSK